MGCIFRANGRSFDVDHFLQSKRLKLKGAWKLVKRLEFIRLTLKRSKQKKILVWHKGELLRSNKPRGARHKDSGFSFTVSRADYENLGKQIRDVVAFLKANRNALRFLHRCPGVESLEVDFPIDRIWGTVVQWHTFPSELLRLTGEHGVDLCITFYAPIKPKSKSAKSNAKVRK